MNTLSWKRVVVSSTVIVFLQGVIMTPLDNPWSTTTLIELYPLLSNRSVMKLVEMNCQGTFVVSNGCMGGCVWCVKFFVGWHVVQPSTYLWMNFVMLAHQ